MAMKALAAVGFALLSSCAYGVTESASGYPARPVRIVAPFTAGSSSDMLGRLLAAELAARLRQNVIVDNRPGAGGMLGSTHVAGATPDGHTLLIASGAFTSVAAVTPKLPFDPVRDFAWVARVVNYPLLMVVNPNSSVRSVSDLITAARAQAGRITYGSVGIGSGFHLAGEMLNTMASIEMTHVPYKGGNELVTELLGGRLDMIFNTMISAFPHVRARRLRAIAITSRERNVLLPELPSVAETLSGYEMTSFVGIGAPSATPRAVIDRLNREFNAVLGLEDVRRQLLDLGGTVQLAKPREMDRYVADEIQKWTRVARSRNVVIR